MMGLTVPVERDDRLTFFSDLMAALGADAYRLMQDLDGQGWNPEGIDETAQSYARWVSSWVEDVVEEARLIWRASRELESVE